jgi:tetratricopeptide (TPR) repeat protein
VKVRVVAILIVLSAGCASTNQPTVDRRSLRQVALPDLLRVEPSVQTQLRDRHAAMTAKLEDPNTAAADLGSAFGEMGKLLMAAEFHDPAEAALLNAETLAPEDMRWPYYLGHLHRAAGKVADAAAAFERALQSAPDDVPTMIWMGEASLDQGRPEAADPRFTKAIALDPRSAAARYGLGRAALARKDYPRAAQELEQALALDGRASVIHYSLAMAYRGLGDHNKADWHLQRRGAMPIAPDPLRKALDEVLDSALTYEKNADTAGARGEWTAAAAYLRKAVALAPTRPSPRHKLGTALFYLGDKRGAREQFHEALRLSPAFAASHYALGVLHQEAGEHVLAIQSFSAAIESEPTNVDARVGLVKALRRSGQPDRSNAELARLLRIDPSAIDRVKAFGEPAAR